MPGVVVDASLLRFNPLIVGACSVTILARATAVSFDDMFQSPDCRGVFRHPKENLVSLLTKRVNVSIP